ncbi:MAG: response regulator [Agarilytica sp.]
MPQLNKILIVEDNPHVCERLMGNLGNDFVMESAANVEQARNKAFDWAPNVILLDVNLKTRNSYEVCDEFKQNATTEQIPVVFYSENDSVRERMLGYEVGAVDYLNKNNSNEEILAKLHAIAKQSVAHEAMRADAASAQKTAMEALTTSSDLGKSVRYVEHTYFATDFNELAEKLSHFCRDMGLSAIIMFAVRRGSLFYATNNGEVNPIERELMKKLHTTDRFVDFGCRTLTNYTRVSLLVKNMPIENRERYGRLKDTIPFVLGATDARVRMLDAESALTAHCAQLTSSVEAAQLTLDTVKDDVKRNVKIVESIMSELHSTLELDIEKMNMDEKDEEHLLSMVEGTSKKLNIILTENDITDTILKDLVDLLGKLTLQQSQIIIDTLTQKQEEEPNDFEDDIELF